METNIHTIFKFLMLEPHGTEVPIDGIINSNSVRSRFAKMQEELVREHEAMGLQWEPLALKVRMEITGGKICKYISIAPRSSEHKEFNILAGDELLYAGYQKGITGI